MHVYYIIIQSQTKPNKMATIIVESPYGGEQLEKNIEYAWLCVQDSVKRGEAPIAFHLFYTQQNPITKQYAREHNYQTDPTHWITREQGMTCANAWRHQATKTVFYVDLGISPGMKLAQEYCDQHHLLYETRSILS